MLYRNNYPVLEFDDAPDAKLNPSHFAGTKFDTDKLVITFFPEVIEKLLGRQAIREALVIPGENPVAIYRFADDPGVLLTLGQVGCPACAGNLDLFHAMGVTRVMFCGGGGVLDRNIEVGQVLLVEGAIRDEGFSYQYLAPSRVVYADPGTNAAILRFLEENGVPCLQGLTWTTDAIFRETPDRIALRKEEGCLAVDMELAGVQAVCGFHGFSLYDFLITGDVLDAEEYSPEGLREANHTLKHFYLALEIAKRLIQ